MSTNYLRSFIESGSLPFLPGFLAFGSGDAHRCAASSCSFLTRPSTKFSLPGVSDVPAELERWFRGMRELDERAHGLQVQLEADCQQQLRLAAEQQQHGNKRAKATGDMDSGPTPPSQPGNEPVDLDQRIEDTTAELLKLSAEKVRRSCCRCLEVYGGGALPRSAVLCRALP